MPPRSSYLSDVGAALRRSFTDAWMVTFADLVALMLTFFVLLFSMSTVNLYLWQNLTRSLAGNLDSIQARDEAKPAVEFQIEQEAPAPATDLDYLTPVIEQQLASEPDLSPGVVWRTAGRTVISFPAAALFDGEGAAIAPRAGSIVYAMSRLIQTLDNLVEVHGHVAAAKPGAGAAAGWRRSLARARALAEGMAQAGYRERIVARGYGAARQVAAGPPGAPAGTGGAAKLAQLVERLDIVIHEVAPSGS